jgi:hypothetical protein
MATFDSCHLGDLDKVIERGTDQVIATRAYLETRARQLFREFFAGGGFRDRNYRQMACAFKQNDFQARCIDKLRRGGVITETENARGTFYEVGKVYHRVIQQFVENGRTGHRMASILQQLA